MRTLHRYLILALGTPLLLAASQAQTAGTVSPNQSDFNSEQRTEIVQIIRQALKDDPTLLRDAITSLKMDDKRQQEETARVAIGKAQDQLTKTTADPIAGNQQGERTVVEFYDLQCPFCRRMLPVMHDLATEKGKLRIVYKDIPIEGPGSMLAAKAVMAAQKQGGYLKLQNAIMTGPQEVTEKSLQAAVEQAGLDWNLLRHDMDDPAIQARIDANLALSRSLGVQGTPTYVVGDRMFSGAMTLQQLEEAIDVAAGAKPGASPEAAAHQVAENH
jgi:protein-disulfide isomerase